MYLSQIMQESSWSSLWKKDNLILFIYMFLNRSLPVRPMSYFNIRREGFQNKFRNSPAKEFRGFRRLIRYSFHVWEDFSNILKWNFNLSQAYVNTAIGLYSWRQKCCARLPKYLYFQMLVSQAKDKISKFCLLNFTFALVSLKSYQLTNCVQNFDFGVSLKLRLFLATKFWKKNSCAACDV